MEGWKFLHSADVPKVLVDGTVRLGSLSHYRSLEGLPWIADKMEGSSGTAISLRYNVGREELSSLTPIGYKPVVEIGPDAINTVISGISLVWQGPEYFIFSASIKHSKGLADAMFRKEGYDRCLKIADIAALAHRLYFRGSIINLAGAKMRHLFERPQWQAVKYDNAMKPHTEGRALSPSPFLKGHHFASQDEVRIAFRPRENVDRKFLLVNIPRIDQMFFSIS